jgi:hypothetical protein
VAFVRDTYYEALYQRLMARVPGITTWSRQYLQFSRLPPAAQPACLVLAANQGSQRERGLPVVWTLVADVVIWVRATGQKDSLDTVLNGIIDEVDLALDRDATEAQGRQVEGLRTTLGGLVESVEYAGDIDINQREGAEEASVVIPIVMTVLGTG